MHFRLIAFLVLAGLVSITGASAVAASSVPDRVAGRIVLQVERNGEAWYVHPETKVRMYLGRPADAFRIMREQGLGITNADLEKIPIARIYCGDAVVGSSTEPMCDPRRTPYFADPVELHRADSLLVNRLKGKILLQVEDQGRAWYVHPVNGWRYALGTPMEAFITMSNLGLGITNADLRMIPLSGDGKVYPNKTVYGTAQNDSRRGEYELDCRLQTGTFNSCGSICGPESQVCPAVCALTCTF